MKPFADKLRRVNPNIWAAIVATAIYALITLIVTYPVALKLTSAVAGFDGRDSLQYVWSLWWAHKAIVDLGTSPANLTFLYHPTGAYHPLLFVTPYLELVSLPLEGLLNPITVYNIQFLLSFVLTGLTTYLLGLELTGNRYAAFIGGLIFAFFPSRMGHALAGHLPQITTYWFPLYVLFLIRLNKDPSLKNSLWCGIFLTLSLLINIMHIAYFLIPVTLVFLLYQGWSKRRFLDARFLIGRRFSQINADERIKSARVSVNLHSVIEGLGLALLLAGLLTAPFFVPFVASKFTGKLGFLSEEGTLDFSNDLLAFVSPSRYHPLLGRLGLWPSFTARIFQRPRDLEEKIAYLGLVPLLLGWLAIRRNREARVWAILGLCAAILSLGPFLKVGGELVRYTIENEESYMLLPYAVLKKLPFYEWGRTPGRLSETAMFALAVLATYGAARIAEILNGKRIKAGIFLGLSLLILFEYNVMFPFPVGGEERPSYYQEIANAASLTAEDYAILDVPIAESRYVSNYAMFYQTFHEHKIVGGRIHRDPPGTVDVVKDISALVQPFGKAQDRPGNSDSTKAERLQRLRTLGIGRVVVHKRKIEEEATYLNFLRDLLGEEIFEDAQIAVFAVPDRVEVKE